MNSFQDEDTNNFENNQYKEMMKSLGQNPSDFLGNNNQNLDMENLNSMMKNFNIENYNNFGNYYNKKDEK